MGTELNIQKRAHRIGSVEEGSIAWEMELEPGDVLLEINGEKIEDILDYHFLANDVFLNMTVQKKNGEIWELEIEKDYDDDLGIEFEEPLMDHYRSCRNKCIFCFIDQLPAGMRRTLYFKDDDSRLSFLQGNYVTLTNMDDHDIDRIIRYHLSPINISFHTMNPSLRCRMLHNRFAGEALKKAERLADAGIEMNGQIVLCKGINDGEELDHSLKCMERYLPRLQSVSVVPVGLTRYRDGLYPLEPFLKEDAVRVLDQIVRWQDYYLEKYGIHFVHAGDEWYLMAGREFPPAENYDGYLQLENGVGMVRLLCDETQQELSLLAGDDRKRSVSVATGVLAAPLIRSLARKVQERFPNVLTHVYAVENRFFGEKITVSGLLTGRDLIGQLSGEDLGEQLLLSCNMLRSGENVFLDDVTTEQLENTLQTPVRIVKSSGSDFVHALIGETDE